MFSLLAIFVAHGESGAQLLREIPSAPGCGTCTIVLTEEAVLRLPADSLSFGIEAAFTRIASGAFVARGLSETPVPALLSPSGEFVRLIARQGSGPGEITLADLVVSTPSDTVWVIGPSQRHVHTSEMQFVRTDNVSGASELLPLPDGRVVIAARIMSPGRVGYPLHLANADGRIVLSLGLPSPVLDADAQLPPGDGIERFMLRFLVPGDSGSFWTWNPTRFLLERYSSDGKLMARYQHALDGWYQEATAHEATAGASAGLRLFRVQQSAEPGILWLIYLVRNANYGTARTGPGSAFTRAGQYDIVIEALDTRAARVLATTRLPATDMKTIRNGSDLLAIHRPAGAHFSEFVVTRMTLRRR